jgi:hypothetical protein
MKHRKAKEACKSDGCFKTKRANRLGHINGDQWGALRMALSIRSKIGGT